MSKEMHQKHGATVKPALGHYGRNEWAIIGAPCGVIRTLAYELCGRLSPKWQVAYLDADHSGEVKLEKDTAEELQGEEGNITPVVRDHTRMVTHLEISGLAAHRSTPDIEYTDKISFHRFDLAAQPDSFRFKQAFHEMDAVLINGNHFKGQRQIVIIDPAKKDSLQRKLDQLTNVQLILLQEGMSKPWPFLEEHLAGKSVPVFSLSNVNAIAAWIGEQLQAAVPTIRGLVLAGGYSKRMGQDKGLIEYHGKPQREYIADLLSGLCSEVFISCRADQAHSITETYTPLSDSFFDLGPYGAMLSAFRAYPDSAWLVVACDLPLMDEATLSYLVQHRNPSRVATAFHSPNNEFPEPLITIWEPKCYPTLLQYLSQGYSCPRKVLINSNVALLSAPDARALTNVNSPEDWSRIKQNLPL